MKLDILAFGAHPDDIELGCGGTLALQASKGHKTGLIDLTLGELGTRGTPEIRLEEAKEAATLLGAVVRENMRMRDGFFKADEEHILKIVEKIRFYQPGIVICNAVSDRHPDHGRGGALVSKACFYAGLRKIETSANGVSQAPWRPSVVYHYIQFYPIEPDFVVDVSAFMEQKMESVKAHRSQFYDPSSKEPSTLISSPEFMDNVINRAKLLGHYIGATYGEGFTTERYTGVKDLADLR